MDRDASVLLSAVEGAVLALEAACASAERSLHEGNWDEVATSISDQRRLTQAIINAMHAAKPVRNKEFDANIFKRLGFIGAARDSHIQRLQKYQDEIKVRLAQINRWKSVSRSWLKGFQRQRGIGLVDQIR